MSETSVEILDNIAKHTMVKMRVIIAVMNPKPTKERKENTIFITLAE